MAALALAVTGSLVPALSTAQAAPSTDHTSITKRLPRPERPAARTPQAYDPHAVLVKFKSGTARSAKDRALSRRAARIASQVGRTGYVKVSTEGSATELLAALRKDPTVASVSLDYQRRTTASPNDEFYAYGDQEYLKSLRLPQAWDVSKGSTAQIIAVVDTGVRTTHEDLTGRTVAGYNAITKSTTAASYQDDFGHGTEVAGVAGANTNNAIGVAGASWTSRIMPVKVLDKTGSGYDSDIADGVIWAADHGAKVINLSLGGTEDNQVLHDAIKYAYNKGAVVVVAAGNDGDGTTQYPAAYPEALAVAATDYVGRVTDFSSSGDWVDVAAPGFNLTSTAWNSIYPTENDWYVVDGASGTSYAAPLVSGIAALIRTKYPTMTPAQVMARLRWATRDAGPRGIDPYYGYGFVDAYQALGGRWTTELTGPGGDGNDTPDRATPLPVGTTSGSVGIEGDFDWYRFQVTAQQQWSSLVSGGSISDTVAQSFDPVVGLYNADLRLIRQQDAYGPGVGEQLKADLDPGTYYLSVRSFNGSRGTAYNLTTAVNPVVGAVAPAGQQLWVRNVNPAPNALGQPVTTTPSVTFARPLLPESVTTSTVRLVNGRTGGTVPTSLTPVGNSVTLTPNGPLQDNTPYRIVASGVKDSSGVTMSPAYSSVFRTVDTAPGKVGSLAVKGGYRAATLSWTLPSISDLDQVVVRMAAGTTAPTSPTSGTSVYAGTGTTVTAKNLVAGSTYSFSVWVKDRTGHYSAVSTGRATGTATSITSSVTGLTYGKSVQVSGKVVRKDTGAAIAGVPVELMVRRKGTTTFSRIATVTSNSVGYVAYTHKPTWSAEYMWTYRGSGAFVGASSVLRSVAVAPVVYANLSRTSFALGGSATLSGSVAPAHAGQAVYLQRLVSGVWKTETSKALSSTSAYAFSIKPPARGTYSYRVYKPADSDHAAGYSPTRTVTVS
ncbi:type VII secretion-associated serine protease mycosin [Micromonospora mirobrigensis]|uniref:Type VII secretion-associated serine protease mycosin n=1 Tax=Micromonospora mirobrigensis TaxID=262898 RepID=A0A1C4VA11_9ACTN|nr:type VII secretion-associated serine protease mycosin [Micromonospora mirobrigensis]